MLFKVNQFCIEDLDQVILGHPEVIVLKLLEYVIAQFLFIHLDGELADAVFADLLAAEVEIIVLDLQDEHYVLPGVPEPDMIGKIFEYHFHGIVEAIVEGPVVLIMEHPFLHKTAHFALINYLVRLEGAAALLHRIGWKEGCMCAERAA
jgi:hypothetical protein